MNRLIRDASTLDATFPEYLAADKKIGALAKIASEQLAALAGDNDLLSIYTRISALPESLLDILAVDFGVDWYDADGSIDVKRSQIASLFYVHKHKGTVSSVKQALTDLYESATLEEWLDYGGNPGFFRVKITDPVSYNQSTLNNALELSKKLSAVLEEVRIGESQTGSCTVSAGSLEVMTEQVYLVIRTGQPVYDDIGNVVSDDFGTIVLED